MKQTVVFGTGAIRQLGRLVADQWAGRMFLVTGGASFERSGAAAALHPITQQFESVNRFCDFTENPKLEDVERGIEQFQTSRPALVLAVGGGSVLDMAKLVNVLAAQSDRPLDVVQGRAPIRRPGVPLIAVPTTAGSGSEATHFGVVYVAGSKYSVAAPALLPDAAVVDPALTYSLSPSLTAIGGMDAFAQAVESYWSVNSTDRSKSYARRAIELVLDNLPTAVHDSTPVARRAMAKAAHFAGRAINITKTTGAHAISYPLTSHFGIPHGHAVSLTLGQWLLFNSQVTDRDVADPRGAGYVRRTVDEIVGILGCGDAQDGCCRIEALMRSVGLETRIGSLGVTRSDILNVVVPNVNVERVINNPRSLTAGALQELVLAAC